MNDFTLTSYRSLLKSVLDSGYRTYGITSWIAERPSRGVLIRHDIDRTPFNALAVAKIEAELGISSTYYFRIIPSCYKPKLITTIRDLGHEIGYHYEDLAFAKGVVPKAFELFRSHLQEFRGLTPIKSIAMHGSPLSPFDNREIWKHFDWKTEGIESEAFLSVDYSNVYYLTDTGRTWGETRANLRDRPNKFLVASVDSTDSLINFIMSRKPEKLALVTHPERWSDRYFHWHFQLARDHLFNSAKLFLRILRSQKSETNPKEQT